MNYPTLPALSTTHKGGGYGAEEVVGIAQTGGWYSAGFRPAMNYPTLAALGTTHKGGGYGAEEVVGIAQGFVQR